LTANRKERLRTAGPSETNKRPLARIFHSHLGKSREKPYEKKGANTFECVVEKTRHAGLETCDTAGWEACATMVCHGFAGFTMKYPG